MSGDSGSGVNTTNRFEPPAWTTNYQGSGAGPFQDYMNKAINLTNEGYQQYGGQRVADLNTLQREGQGMTLDIARNGSPDLNAARGQLMATTQGSYLNNPWTGAGSTLGRTAGGDALNSNPWFGGDSALGQTAGGAMLNSNPWLGSNTALGQAASGQMLTNNPYLSNQANDAVIAQNAQNQIDAHRLGTAAQTDAQFARSGAFGGSAYNQMVAGNAAGLANSVGQMANTARLGQQGLQSQSYQNERNLMQNAGLAGLGNFAAERGLQQNAALAGGQNFANERGLQQNAALAGLGAYGTERQNQLQAASMAPGMAATDYAAAGAIQGVGDQNAAYTQQLMDQGYQDYLAQQQHPYQQLDTLGNALTRASGGGGGSSSTYQTGAQQSPWASILGLGLMGAGAYGAYK